MVNSKKPPTSNLQPPTTPPLVVILGSTASGKTAAGIELAKQVNGEIICADSRTIYRGMDIGTAKPTLKEQQGVPHHLLDIVHPNERFSAAEFKKRATEKINEIWSQGKIPIMVGGTGLYIDSVLFDYQFSTEDARRDAVNSRHLSNADQSDRKKPLRGNTLVLGISVQREVLRARIEARVEAMFEDGFLSEVKALAKQYGWENESMSGIGYRLARQYVEGGADEHQVKEAFVSRDMSLAKRQMTWFKRNPYIHWFESSDELIESGVKFATDASS